MLFWILITISVLGFGYAGYKDLKTTEFPDWLPYGIIVSVLAVRAVFTFIYGDFWILGSSLLIGGLFLAMGLTLYYAKQWGDGDAWLLGAIGFAWPGIAGMSQIPVTMVPFPLTMLLNFFLLSFIYLIVYSVALGFRNRKAVKKFFRDLRGDLYSIKIVTAGFAVACISLATYLYIYTPIPASFIMTLFMFPLFLLGLLIFMRYGRFVENNLFKKEIAVGDVQLGDVPVGSKWKVMTEKELAKLKKKGGKIWIKEGVRFAPVFIITILITVLYGNLFSLLFL